MLSYVASARSPWQPPAGPSNFGYAVPTKIWVSQLHLQSTGIRDKAQKGSLLDTRRQWALETWLITRIHLFGPRTYPFNNLRKSPEITHHEDIKSDCFWSRGASYPNCDECAPSLLARWQSWHRGQHFTHVNSVVTVVHPITIYTELCTLLVLYMLGLMTT